MLLPKQKGGRIDSKRLSLPLVLREKTGAKNIAQLFHPPEEKKDEESVPRRRRSKEEADANVAQPVPKAPGTAPPPLKRGRAPRLLTLNKEIVYDRSLEASSPPPHSSRRPSTGFSPTGGALGSTMRSWENSPQPRSSRAQSFPTPSTPSSPSGAPAVSVSLSYAGNDDRGTPSAPSRLSLKASRSGSQQRASTTQHWRRSPTPAWSLRYCEFAGSTTDDREGHESKQGPAAPPEQEAASGFSKSAQSGAAREKRFAENAVIGETGQAVGDKRIERVRTRPERQSRYTCRRHAIQAHGPSRLKVVAAVNVLRMANPNHIKKLAKLCEAGGHGDDYLDDDEDLIVPEAVKELSTKELQNLSVTTGLPVSEIQTLHQVYEHYDFDMSGNLDMAEISSLMADMGLQPRTKEEKVEINDILTEQVNKQARQAKSEEVCLFSSREVPTQFTFEAFLKVVKAVSEKLRELQSIECLQLFQTADQDDSGTLDMEETKDIMEVKLGLTIHTDEEDTEVNAIFRACDGDNDNAVNFEEFQEFIQRARAKLLMMRREREMTIAKAFQLNKNLVREFTSDLPKLWDLFQRYDHRSQGVVGKEDLPTILMDVGIAPSEPNFREYAVVMDIVNETGLAANDFPRMLKLINETRKRCKESVQEELYDQYLSYDKDGDGSISMPEIFQILGEFGMLPKSKEQQHEIVFVIERLDKDGSGTFDFDEFQDFFQKLTEHVRMSEREREREAVVKFNFTDLQISILRRVYQQLCIETMRGNSSHVTLHCVAKSLQDLRTLFCMWSADEDDVKIFAQALNREADRSVSFVEFSKMVKVGLLDATEEDSLPALDRLRTVVWW